MLKLQRCLRGEAKRTGGSAKAIMRSLEIYFGRPEFIVETVLNKIKHLSPIKHFHIDQLISFSTEVQNLVSVITTLNHTGHLQNPHLLRDLVNKLPEFLKQSWGEIVAENKGSVDLI